MPPKVLKSPVAERDLDEIWFYIAKDNIDAADRVLRRIQDKCQQYATQPLMGGHREDLGENLRNFVVGSYVIFYRPLADGIEVVRVIHGARDVDAMFD